MPVLKYRPEVGSPWQVVGTTVDGYSKEETDILLSKKANKDTIVNPNLLDNWYFGNPVDQRGGYVVPPGVPYYVEGQWPTQAGTTDTYVAVHHWQGGSPYSGNPIFVKDGVNYEVGNTSVVRGYTGEGYTIDRWMLTGDPHITIVNNKIIYENTDNNYASFKQRVENPSQYIGKTLTFSVLARAISGSPAIFIPYHSTTNLRSELSVVSHTFVYGSIPDENTSELSVEVWSNGAAASFEIVAAKLELGGHQTLAHQDSNGNWVLNEIPNYGEQLARCQRYQFVPDVADHGTYQFIFNSSFSNRMAGEIPFPVTMRTIPSLSLEGIRMRNNNEATVVTLQSAVTTEYMSKDCFGMFWNVSVSNGVLSDGGSYSFMDKIIFDANL